MGIFIHALDARTGEVRWTNDGDGSIYMKQPHNTDAFAAVAPQGPMVVLGERLLIPGGRSVPACYDRGTGKMLRYQLNENGKRGGGHEVAAGGACFFNGGTIFDADTEKALADVGKCVVVTPDHVYAIAKDALKVYDFKGAKVEETESTDRKGKTTKTSKWVMKELSSVRALGVECLIKAGSRLYAAAGGSILTVDLQDDGQPSAVWKMPVEGTVAKLIAADDRLFAVTYE